MAQIKLMNKIAKVGLDQFNKSVYELTTEADDPDGMMVRSASLHEMEFGKNLLAIARCGAGVNNIPVDECAKQGIVVFNTPGANANAVKELVIGGLVLASRRVAAGIDWCKTLKGEGDAVGKLVEKGKSQFAGPEIAGKTLGVIGLGAIGRLVAVAANALGMRIVGYDPFLNDAMKAALPEGTVFAASLDEVYAAADYITLHLPCVAATKGMINADTIAAMKDGVRILNFARGELVVSADLAAALASGKVAAYVTDFVSDDLLGLDNVTALPHLGASTPESEENCAAMAAVELREFLEKGTIKNSVNFPNVSLDRLGESRICVLHQNMPRMLNQFLEIIASTGYNVEHMVNKARGEIAYTIIDTSGRLDAEVADRFRAVPGTQRVRVL